MLLTLYGCVIQSFACGIENTFRENIFVLQVEKYIGKLCIKKIEQLRGEILAKKLIAAGRD